MEIMNRKVLLVEDEKSIADPIIYNLKFEEYKVTHVDDGKIALEIFEEEFFDLIILDIMLPEVSGLDILKTIRAKSEVPIIIVTARNAEDEKIAGLELGADDYITKPFSINELLSRIKAVLRRSDQDKFKIDSTKTDLSKIVVKNLEISPLRYEVKLNGSKVNLKPREFELLYFLCQNAGKIISREDLFKKVWGYSFNGSTKTLDVHIQRIRDKLEKNPKKPEILITVRGVGYKIND